MDIPIHRRSPLKKILVLSSQGGYGHAAANIAIQEILKDRYQFSVIYPIEEAHQFGIQSGENLYNLLLKHEWIRITNFMSNRLAPFIFHMRHASMEASIKDHALREKPDLILSLIPFVNYPASEAARKLGIPYLLITTDNDLTNWALGLHKLKHTSFRVTIGRDHAKTRGLLLKQGIEDEHIDTIGLPIHPTFFKEANPIQIKKEFGFPLDKPIVSLIMGGAGGYRAQQYAEEILKMNIPMHLVLCTGKNTRLYHKLATLSGNANVSLSVLQFTDKIADLMQISQVLITKPGPGTINEAMARRLPILVDSSHSTLAWEKVNLEIIKRERVGRVLSRIEDVHLWLPKYLYDPEFKEKTVQAYEALALPHFADKLEKTIEKMIQPSHRIPLADFSQVAKIGPR